MLLSSDTLRTEEVRIQQAYSRRRDGNLYSRFNPAYLFMVQEREKRFLAALSRSGCTTLESKKMLEIGCGGGDMLRDFIKWGARPENLIGIDLLPERVEEAKDLCPVAVEIRQGNAAILQFPDESFDVVVQSTVFTSVMDADVKRQMAAEMRRVLKSDGLILWYDFRVDNPWNPDVRGVERNEIHKLFPGCDVTLRRVTLLPPLARRLAPYSWMGCYLLEKIPWLCTHYLGVIQKPRQ
jgi:ubiquinone/menaquinone biosynthesis C-methylase UbiE